MLKPNLYQIRLQQPSPLEISDLAPHLNHGIEGHLAENKSPKVEVVDDKGKRQPNPQCVTWRNNDGLLVTWFLGTISESVLSMIENAETAHQVWSSLEE